MSNLDKDRPYTVIIEGNIGCGKSTLLQHLAQIPDTETFQEPVTEWRDVRGHNTLGLMYEDPKRWSFTFQSYVQLTMMKLHEKKASNPKAIKIMERSLYSSQYCFAENLRISGTMPEVYDRHNLRNLVEGLFICCCVSHGQKKISLRSIMRF